MSASTFPQGMLSEWYPVVKDFKSGHDNDKKSITGNAYLDWGTVRLTPPAAFAAVRVQDDKGEPVPAALPPVEADDHYGRARETDSAIVETVDVNRGSHFEKFLFYRGLGNFDLPVKLTALGQDRFEVTNSADIPSGALLLVRIEIGRIRFIRLDHVHPRSTIEAKLPARESSVDALAEEMVRELTASGLYEKEALAMVNTWRSSWFGENGTRLLYLVPERQTNELLPLHIESRAGRTSPHPRRPPRNPHPGRLPAPANTCHQQSSRPKIRNLPRNRTHIPGPLCRTGTPIRNLPIGRRRRRAHLEELLAETRDGR